MDLSLFSSLITNLLHTDVLHTKHDKSVLALFEKKYCFHESLQPMFTAEALAYLTDSMQDAVFYEIVDTLDIYVLFFSFAGEIFFVGPYVKNEYDEKKIQALLIENSLPASYAISLKLYYTAFPLLGTYHVQMTLTACIRSFSPASLEYTYRRLHGFHEELATSSLKNADTDDYSELYRRYDAENHFMKMIETGNVKEVLLAYNEIASNSSTKQFNAANTVYQNPMTGLSILRTLSRKAAERGGLSVVKIDEITQKAVQRMSASKSYLEQGNDTRNMVFELTKAVQTHQQHSAGYSTPTKRIVEYLSLHYSQDIPLDTLSNLVHLSKSHVSRTFKSETGQTITSYLGSIRCSHAADMLLDNNLTIEAISSYVGYLDSNYFVKVFKKRYGKTPSAYRSDHAH